MVEIAHPNADVIDPLYRGCLHHCDLRSPRTLLLCEPVRGSKNRISNQMLQRRTLKDTLQRHGTV